MATKLGKVVTYNEGFSPVKPPNPFNTWSHKVTGMVFLLKIKIFVLVFYWLWVNNATAKRPISIAGVQARGKAIFSNKLRVRYNLHTPTHPRTHARTHTHTHTLLHNVIWALFQGSRMPEGHHILDQFVNTFYHLTSANELQNNLKLSKNILI